MYINPDLGFLEEFGILNPVNIWQYTGSDNDLSRAAVCSCSCASVDSSELFEKSSFTAFDADA